MGTSKPNGPKNILGLEENQIFSGNLVNNQRWILNRWKLMAITESKQRKRKSQPYSKIK